MISFPIIYLVYPFIALISFWIILAFFNIYHTLKYGYINYISYFMTFILIGGAIIILFITNELLIGIDWTQIISF